MSTFRLSAFLLYSMTLVFFNRVMLPSLTLLHIMILVYLYFFQ